MYRREPRHQLSFDDFCLPFGGKLSGDNRWIKLAELIPWDELVDDYAPKFCKGFGAPAKPFRMALGALIIKARLGLTDEELVEQIRKNPYLQFFIGLEAFQYAAPFDQSMMVYFRKRMPAAVVNDCNERIVRHGLKVIRSTESQDPGDHSGSGGPSASPGDQQRSTPQKQPNQGSLLIDAMHPQIREHFGHKPRTYRRKARQQFLAVAKKKTRINKIRKAIKQQLVHLKRNVASIDAKTA
jgi:IS5 family transposase